MDILKSVWLNIYPLMCVFVPCVAAQLIFKEKLYGFDGEKRAKIKHLLFVYVFILYIFCAIDVAGIGTVWDIGHFGSVVRLEEINIIPFNSDGVMTYVLNIIMLMPLGFLLPLIWKQYERLSRTVFFGFCFSFLIECAQLFNRRQSDIDDLIMNTLGALIGFFIWKFWYWICSKRKLRFQKVKSSSVAEPIVYMGLSVLGSFLLVNWWFFLRIFYSEYYQ